MYGEVLISVLSPLKPIIDESQILTLETEEPSHRRTCSPLERLHFYEKLLLGEQLAPGCHIESLGRFELEVGGL